MRRFMCTIRIVALFIFFAALAPSGVHAASIFIDWSSITEGAGGGITASVSSTVSSGTFSFGSIPADDPYFVSQFALSYSALHYKAGSGSTTPGDISSEFTFSSPLPSGSKLIVTDVDFDEETLTLTSSGSPLSLLEQIESMAGVTSVFPNYYPSTGKLITAGTAQGGLNIREASIFDLSGLSDLRVSFENGSYDSGSSIAIAMPVTVPLPGSHLLFTVGLGLLTVLRRKRYLGV